MCSHKSRTLIFFNLENEGTKSYSCTHKSIPGKHCELALVYRYISVDTGPPSLQLISTWPGEGRWEEVFVCSFCAYWWIIPKKRWSPCAKQCTTDLIGPIGLTLSRLFFFLVGKIQEWKITFKSVCLFFFFYQGSPKDTFQQFLQHKLRSPRASLPMPRWQVSHCHFLPGHLQMTQEELHVTTQI